MKENIEFLWKSFHELSNDEIYEILHLRQEVFVVEQNCPYLDADYCDQDAFHLMGRKSNKLVAYMRAFGPKLKYVGSSLGRVVIKKEYRNKSLGKRVTNMGVAFLNDKFPNCEVVISAQYRLKDFYMKLGFTIRGKKYLEDEIDHIQMYI